MRHPLIIIAGLIGSLMIAGVLYKYVLGPNVERTTSFQDPMRQSVSDKGEMKIPSDNQINADEAHIVDVEQIAAMDEKIHKLDIFSEDLAAERRTFRTVAIHLSDQELRDLNALRNSPIVINVQGKLSSDYLRKNDCQGGLADGASTICKETILSKVNNKLVYDGTSWVKGFQLTGIGQEVVRVK